MSPHCHDLPPSSPICCGDSPETLAKKTAALRLRYWRPSCVQFTLVREHSRQPYKSSQGIYTGGGTQVPAAAPVEWTENLPAAEGHIEEKTGPV